MLLPFRPKPKQDELLSSWLVRLARGYRMRIDDFLSSTDIGAYIRSFDCDRIRSGGLFALLCDRTGTAHVRLPFSDAVESRSANWSWLIPLGRSGRNTQSVGFQICPLCGFRIHSYAFSLFGLRRACDEVDGTFERCDRCSFDLRSAVPGQQPLFQHENAASSSTTAEFNSQGQGVGHAHRRILRRPPTHH